MTNDSDSYSVVILGDMNPRIHHPLWYRTVGLFTERDVTHTIKSQPVVCTPGYAQFAVDEYVITCLQDRWEIRTPVVANAERIRDMAMRIFDDLLGQTPVRDIATNFDYVRSTPGRNATAFLARILTDSAARLGLGTAYGGDLFFKQVITAPPRFAPSATIAVRSSVDSEALVVNCNFHYKVTEYGGQSSFKIAEFLPDCGPRDQTTAQDSLSAILNAVNAD
jgi:hypothetical protein